MIFKTEKQFPFGHLIITACRLFSTKQVKQSNLTYCKLVTTDSKTNLRVTIMAEGCAQAVMRVTMKRKMRKGMSVLQVRSHFPDTA